MISVMYFSTSWCGPCKMFWPTVQEVCSANSINLQKVDAEQSPDLASQYQITGVPTLIVMKNGQPVFRNTGAMAKTKLIDTLQNLS
jgi:thioredoxin 1